MVQVLVNHPFTKCFFVIVAMTGVAATSICVEAIHRSTMLLSQNEVTFDQIKVWRGA